MQRPLGLQKLSTHVIQRLVVRRVETTGFQWSECAGGAKASWKSSKQAMRLFCAISLLLIVCGSGAFAQTDSSSISGKVEDSSGALIKGASVTAAQAEQSITLRTKSDEHGDYIFPEVVPGTYTITVEANGFKTMIQTNLIVAPTTKVSAGDVKLSVGGVNETVTVSVEGQHLQLESAERAEDVTHQELLDVPIDSGAASGRSFMGALALVPGVQSFEASSLSINVNGGQAHQNNATLDGVLNVDAGGNGGILVDLNADNVGEMHVSTHDGGPEYGREGTTIAVTTASGTSKYHGEATWFHRHEDLNANSWANKRTGTITPRARARLNEFSGNIGGPVAIPHLFERFHDKMFFFVGEDVQSPLLAQGLHNVNLPTYAESQGNFSSSVNKNNAKVYLTDNTVPGNGYCTATSNGTATGAPAPTVAVPGRCYVGTVNGVPTLNVIPTGRQSALGQTILGIYKNYIPTAGYLGYPSAGIYGSRMLPTAATQVGYNATSQISDSESYRQDIYRVDFNPTDTWQTHVRWANLKFTKSSYYGASFSDGTNLPTTPFSIQTPGYGLAVGATKTLNSSTTNEITFGFNVGKIHGYPTTTALTKTALGIESIPLLFNSSVQDQTPDLEFGGGNLANSPQILTNDAPYQNANTAIDVLDNFSKVLGRHQLQAGIQYERLRKNQFNAGQPGGVYQFGDDANNSLDTSDAYANALTGVFDTLSQQSALPNGKYRYGALDFYGQDTWKVSPRLTVIGGLRVQHWSPWYDKSGQSLNFDASRWSASVAPRLYYPTATGSTDLGVPGSVFPKSYAGLLVPGSGSYENGLVAQDGAKFTTNLGTAIPTTSKYLFSTKQWLFSPHVGLTYDVYGNQKTVFRMGAGSFYDRVSGNFIFNMIQNPPTLFSSTAYYGTFNGVSTATGLIGAPSILSVANGAQYPITWQFNSDVQQQLPGHAVLTVAYVGSSSSHLITSANLNYSPYGTTFLPQNQNPAGTSSIPGANAYPQVELNAYRGFGNITNNRNTASSNYNSMQVGVSRRYVKGLFVQATYTWGKILGTTSNDFGGGIDYLGRTRQLLYTPASYDRRSTFTAVYSYELPSLFRESVLHAIADGWQISGITYLWTGTPFSIGQTVYVPGTTTSLGSANLTGSYTEGARVQLVSNPFIGVAKSGPYNRLNPTAFMASGQGSAANPLGYLGQGMRGSQYYGPGLNNTDMSLQKNFVFASERVRLQLRADAFNVFNHVSYTGYNTTVTFPNGPNTLGTSGAVTSANLASPSNTGGFGGVNGAAATRVVALMARVRF
jgi:hypothetical protein